MAGIKKFLNRLTSNKANKREQPEAPPPKGVKTFSEEELRELENEGLPPPYSQEAAAKAVMDILKSDKQAAKNLKSLKKLSKSVVIEDVNAVSSLPNLASLAGNIKDVLSNENADMDEVVASVSKDMVLASKIIKLVNSAFFRGGEEVLNLEGAVARLGLQEIRRLSSFTKILDDTKNIAPDFNWKCLWIHSIGTDICANDLATMFGFEKDHFVDCAGLIHDVGKVILSDLYPDHYSYILSQSSEHSLQLADLEKEIFGLTHEQVGTLFARNQSFPERLVDAIQFHSNPLLASEETRAEPSITQVANYLVKLHGIGFSGDRSYLDQECEQLPGWHYLMQTANKEYLDYVNNLDNYFPISIKASLRKIRASIQIWFPPDEQELRNRRKNLQ